METLSILRKVALLLLVLWAEACASAPAIPPIHHSSTIVAARLTDMSLPIGANCVLQSVNREHIRGQFQGLSNGELMIRSSDTAGTVVERRIAEADIVLVARVVGMSKGTRRRLGAAIAAAASVPLGISMYGDMVIPAAIIGALVGGGTGDSRAEVVFERRFR